MKARQLEAYASRRQLRRQPPAYLQFPNDCPSELASLASLPQTISWPDSCASLRALPHNEVWSEISHYPRTPKLASEKTHWWPHAQNKIAPNDPNRAAARTRESTLHGRQHREMQPRHRVLPLGRRGQMHHFCGLSAKSRETFGLLCISWLFSGSWTPVPISIEACSTFPAIMPKNKLDIFNFPRVIFAHKRILWKYANQASWQITGWFWYLLAIQ